MRLNKEKRDDAVAEIRRRFFAWYANLPPVHATEKTFHDRGVFVRPDKQAGVEHYCLWWSFFTMMVLRERDVPAQLQAGTAYWPIQTPETDDGVSSTRFGYEFDKDRALESLATGINPEMHVWAAVASPPCEIIDLTSRFFKQRAVEAGMRFAAPDPPDYFWNEGTELPPGVVYMADWNATALAYSMLESAIKKRPLAVAFR